MAVAGKNAGGIPEKAATRSDDDYCAFLSIIETGSDHALF
jgi:hypothetical protein